MHSALSWLRKNPHAWLMGYWAFYLFGFFSLEQLDPEYTIIFGHWASLEGKGTPEGVIGLDTGCCWGGDLTMLRWEDRRYFTQPANRGEAPDHAGRLAAS